MLGAILSVLVSGFVIGGLARWAVPGPDPMPIWLTIAIGLVGSAIGGGIAAGIDRGNVFAIVLAEIFASALIVIVYRRVVQRRPITGPGAHTLPTRGVGVERARERLRRLGIDPDRIGAERTEAEREEALRKLRRQRDDGEISDDEYEERSRRLRGTPEP